MPDPIGGRVAANIAAIRRQRCWTQEDVADRLAAQGWALSRMVLSNIENGTRSITVDDLAAIALALGAEDPWSLTKSPPCEACRGVPPVGYKCLTCDRRSSETLGVQDRPGRRRWIITPELLAEVAAIYRNAVTNGIAPTLAVKDHFGISHQTAGRWVRNARQSGDLGKTRGTQGGEVSEKSPP